MTCVRQDGGVRVQAKCQQHCWCPLLLQAGGGERTDCHPAGPLLGDSFVVGGVVKWKWKTDS